MLWKVAWLGTKEKVTWEVESSLPESLIKEYESGDTLQEDTLSTEPKYGIVSHTVIATKASKDANQPQPKPKRQKLQGFDAGWDSVITTLFSVIVMHFCQQDFDGK